MKLGGPLEVSLRWSADRSVPVGRLALKDRQVFFEFSREFIADPKPISPFHLPVKSGIQVDHERTFRGLHGVFDDSLPDAWGRLLIDRRARSLGLRPGHLTVLDRLACVGDSGIGALTYRPAHDGPSDVDAIDLDALAEDAQRVLAGEAETVLPQLIRLGGSPGGTRPKVMIALHANGTMMSGVALPPPGFEPLIVKFRAPGDPDDMGPLEQAYMEMARAAALDVPPSRLLPSAVGPPHFAIQRFDRVGHERRHVHTLAGLLHAVHTLPALDYDHLLRVTRRLARDQRAVDEAFRRACFNVLAHNRDDHGKQFSFVMDEAGGWKLSPAYDLTFSEGPGGEHSTTVDGEGRAPARTHLLSLAKRSSVQHADRVFDEVRAAVERWPEIAAAVGVSERSMGMVHRTLKLG